jgi:acyl-CoA hydrolase
MAVLIHDVFSCCQRIFAHAGPHLRLATPLGLGKPNVLLNAIYQQVAADPRMSLTLFTALSLARPEPRNALEQRFLAPFLERHFGANYPDLAYVAAQRADALPANVRVREFYLQSGSMLHRAQAQRDYTSLNYTHVARDLAHAGLNVLVQLIAVREQDGRRRLSLASNPDVTLDLLDRIAAAGVPQPLRVGVLHPDLPFIGNEAEIDEAQFDLLLDDPQCHHALFALVREPVSLPEYALGLRASMLVRDGGTLQIGIGTLSDALVHALLLRHQDNARYRAALAALGAADRAMVTEGGVEPFRQGLYGASEMVMDGFMHLARNGILRRRVYDDLALERALAEGRSVDVAGRKDGRYLRGAFFLGSKEFYAWLRGLQGDDFAGLSMTRVSDINQLYGGREQLDALQRRHARFFNTCMMATLLGAAVSDALEDGQVVSGVGGQYNFVAMAHALDDGRSILLLRSTRSQRGRTHSNIVWNYGHTTIPRHLRDIYVTEYGVADLRGKSDEECIIAMLAIADARFQEALAAQAKAAGKLAPTFAIPEAWRHNTPEYLAAALRPWRDQFPAFPFGSDFSAEERRLLPALQRLETIAASKLRLLVYALSMGAGGDRAAESAALRRLGLEQPRGWRERLWRRLVRRALHETEAEARVY